MTYRTNAAPPACRVRWCVLPAGHADDHEGQRVIGENGFATVRIADNASSGDDDAAVIMHRMETPPWMEFCGQAFVRVKATRSEGCAYCGWRDRVLRGPRWLVRIAGWFCGPIHGPFDCEERKRR